MFLLLFAKITQGWKNGTNPDLHSTCSSELIQNTHLQFYKIVHPVVNKEMHPDMLSTFKSAISFPVGILIISIPYFYPLPLKIIFLSFSRLLFKWREKQFNWANEALVYRVYYFVSIVHLSISSSCFWEVTLMAQNDKLSFLIWITVKLPNQRALLSPIRTHPFTWFYPSAFIYGSICDAVT